MAIMKKEHENGMKIVGALVALSLLYVLYARSTKTESSEEAPLEAVSYGAFVETTEPAACDDANASAVATFEDGVGGCYRCREGGATHMGERCEVPIDDAGCERLLGTENAGVSEEGRCGCKPGWKNDGLGGVCNVKTRECDRRGMVPCPGGGDARCCCADESATWKPAAEGEAGDGHCECECISSKPAGTQSKSRDEIGELFALGTRASMLDGHAKCSDTCAAAVADGVTIAHASSGKTTVRRGAYEPQLTADGDATDACVEALEWTAEGTLEAVCGECTGEHEGKAGAKKVAGKACCSSTTGLGTCKAGRSACEVSKCGASGEAGSKPGNCATCGGARCLECCPGWEPDAITGLCTQKVATQQEAAERKAVAESEANAAKAEAERTAAEAADKASIAFEESEQANSKRRSAEDSIALVKTLAEREDLLRAEASAARSAAEAARHEGASEAVARGLEQVAGAKEAAAGTATYERGRAEVALKDATAAAAVADANAKAAARTATEAAARAAKDNEWAMQAAQQAMEGLAKAAKASDTARGLCEERNRLRKECEDDPVTKGTCDKLYYCKQSCACSTDYASSANAQGCALIELPKAEGSQIGSVARCIESSYWLTDPTAACDRGYTKVGGRGFFDKGETVQYKPLDESGVVTKDVEGVVTRVGDGVHKDSYKIEYTEGGTSKTAVEVKPSELESLEVGYECRPSHSKRDSCPAPDGLADKYHASLDSEEGGKCACKGDRVLDVQLLASKGTYKCVDRLNCDDHSTWVLKEDGTQYCACHSNYKTPTPNRPDGFSFKTKRSERHCNVCRHGFGKHTDGSCYKSECGADATCSGNGACKKTRTDGSAEVVLKCHAENDDHGCYTKGATRYTTVDAGAPCGGTTDRTEWCGKDPDGRLFTATECAFAVCQAMGGGLELKRQSTAERPDADVACSCGGNSDLFFPGNFNPDGFTETISETPKPRIRGANIHKEYTEPKRYVTQTREVTRLEMEDVEVDDGKNGTETKVRYKSVPKEIGDKYRCCIPKYTKTPETKYKMNIDKDRQPSNKKKRDKTCPKGHRQKGKRDKKCYMRVPGDLLPDHDVDYKWCYSNLGESRLTRGHFPPDNNKLKAPKNITGTFLG